MRRPTFVHGAVTAAVFALAGSVAVTALAPMAVIPGFYQLLVAAFGLAYLLYMFSVSGQRVGRLTTLSLWAGMSFTLWILGTPFGLYLMAQIGALWLIRSLYFYSSALSALIDLALNLVAVASGYWAAVHTGSVFLTLWCFFLVQALFVAIPPEVKRQFRWPPATHRETEKFERARLRAEKAIRQLFAQ
jgi:hypothetical protein